MAMSEELLPHFNGEDDEPQAEGTPELPPTEGEAGAPGEAGGEPEETSIEEPPGPESAGDDEPPILLSAGAEGAGGEQEETPIEEPPEPVSAGDVETPVPFYAREGEAGAPEGAGSEPEETRIEEPPGPESAAEGEPPPPPAGGGEADETVEERIVFEAKEDDGMPEWQDTDDSTRPHERLEQGHATPTSDIFATLADLPEAEPSTLIRGRGGRGDGGFRRRTVVLLVFASLLMCVVILGGLYALYLLTGSVPEQVARFAAPTLGASGGRAASPTPSPTVTQTPGGGDEQEPPAIGVTMLPTNTAVPPDTPTPLPTATPSLPPPTEAEVEPTLAPPTPVPTLSAPTLTPSIVTDGEGILLAGVSMVYVPGGTFLMGSETTGPAHQVALSPYYIDKYEVTNARWAACVEAGACNAPASTRAYDGSQYYGVEAYDSYPVIFVNWYNADSYCRWRGARLPSEAEWEMAARWDANTGVGTLYPWGDEWDPARLNYCSGSCPLGEPSVSSYDDGWPQTAPVGTFANGVSPVGAFDMGGNVAEWVADWYSAGYYAVSPADNPTGPDSGTLRVVRGGSWGLAAPGLLTATLRSSFTPVSQNAGLGFRCAVAVSDVTQ
jgi:formylglycine-generating enzyme required for sulfatase activity